jgi:hypothetical protein
VQDPWPHLTHCIRICTWHAVPEVLVPIKAWEAIVQDKNVLFSNRCPGPEGLGKGRFVSAAALSFPSS